MYLGMVCKWMDRLGVLRICIFAVRYMGAVWWLLTFKSFILSSPKSVSNKQYLTPRLALPLITGGRYTRLCLSALLGSWICALYVFTCGRGYKWPHDLQLN